MKIQKTLIVVFLFTIFIVNAQETKVPVFGKGIVNLVGQDSTWSMKIGARMQFLVSSVWEENEANRSNFLIRRARLKFGGFAFTPKLKYKLELGLSNRDIAGASIYTGNAPLVILDAVMKYNFAKNLDFWFGQTKIEGNRERIISSANMQMVDRSVLNARFNIDRDIGFQLKHQSYISNNFLIRETLSVTQGEGRNVVTGNLGGFQYTGHVDLLPFGDFSDYVGSDLNRYQTPKLAIGAGYNFNNNAVKTRGNLGEYMVTDTGYYETNISAVFVDAMFKYKGLSFMAEYANRNSEDPIAINSDGTETGMVVQVGDGFNFQSGYLFKNNWEVSGRYSNAKLDEDITGKSPDTEYTLGLSKYIVGHNLKVQTDLTFYDVNALNDLIMWRIQFDVHF